MIWKIIQNSKTDPQAEKRCRANAVQGETDRTVLESV